MTRLSAGKAILYGTLVVGLLDGLDAILFFGLRSGATPVRIFQSISAGVLGRAPAVQGGWRSALLGVLLHFFIAFAVVSTFYLLSRRMRILTRHPILFGMLYGVAVYVAMNYAVIPLSAIGPRPAAIPLAVHINGVLIHALGVGLPSALAARAAASGVYRLKEYRHGGSCPRTAPPGGAPNVSPTVQISDTLGTSPGARAEKSLSRDTSLCARRGAPFAATRERR